TLAHRSPPPFPTRRSSDLLKLTEQALATREEQLRLFTDNIPDPVVYVDIDRHYTFVNDAFLQLVGLDRDETIGKSSPTSRRNARSEEHTSELQSRFDLVCR